jgi:hypothetical protein
LTTVLVLVGPTHVVDGHTATNFIAYRITFLVASVMCLGGIPWSLAVNDADAAHTIPARRQKPQREPEAEPLAAQA